MSIPTNPETIIVKNEFYPKGLTQGQVWNYYQKFKGVVLTNTRGRDLMFAIMTDVNKPILRRKGSNAEYLQLTNSNYDTIINGRTTAIYSTMKAYEDFCVIDIDTDDWNKAIPTTFLIHAIMQTSNFIKTIKILYTGKNSFHLHCKFVNRLPINKIKSLLVGLFYENANPNVFTFLHKRTPQKPNVDISPNKFKGGFISEGSLSIWGLKCMEVPYNKLKYFKQKDARIF